MNLRIAILATLFFTLLASSVAATTMVIEPGVNESFVLALRDATPPDFLVGVRKIIIHNYGPTPIELGGSSGGFAGATNSYGRAWLESGTFEIYAGPFLRSHEEMFTYAFYHELSHLYAQRMGWNYVNGTRYHVLKDGPGLEAAASDAISVIAPQLTTQWIYNLLRYASRLSPSLPRPPQLAPPTSWGFLLNKL